MSKSNYEIYAEKKQEELLLTILDLLNSLNKFHANYEYIEGDKFITFYFENDDRTHIELSDDKKLISVMGRIIGNLSEFENWIYNSDL